MPVTSLRMPSARPPEVAKIKIKIKIKIRIKIKINSQIKSQIKSCAGVEEVGQRHLCQR
ncbi:hypothetical protein [Pseudomonas juntendi]|uniref:hypothetical protein n=1 Tax=Pseudomonas juntendi TaxID=2666183 RepID=UPI001F3C7B57|nr:hypothetical protein [Pseudomonas juntendi]MCO7057670.1 hypothetical protein [Pseudomonas juntendi]UJM13681.1 hypothetical protein L1P09_05690 [Pseudomonas juntendi]UXA39989.1 hypothetical protein KZA81_06360 [Pseudomonas juntendi]